MRRWIGASPMRMGLGSMSQLHLSPLSGAGIRRGLFSDCSACLSDGPNDIQEKILLSTEKPSGLHVVPEDLRPSISRLTSQLLGLPEKDGENTDVSPTMDSAGASALLERSPDGAAFVELLGRLRSRPKLALEVFRWRRKCAAASAGAARPMQPGEYSKAIALAGRARNVELAAELFGVAASEGLRTASTYNSLMAVYMYNGITKRSMSIFDDLKRDKSCNPTIVTYNILLSIFGRSMLVDHMETVLQIIKESKLVPNISTYNTLIAGYLTAWMWDKMEATFEELKEGPLEPDTSTHLLMLRGYAHSGNLDKMESVYELMKERVDGKETTLLRAMICAYCNSSDAERVRKIEELLEHIPQEDYRSWLNVHLIKLYAQEALMEKMEGMICEAFSHNTVVVTSGIMRIIATSYYRNDAVDRLSEFVRRAESAGWKLCTSLYHCRMVLYGRHRRFLEMERVLTEMESSRIYPCRKTYLILYKIFSDNGRKLEASKMIGLMWKRGFPLDYLEGAA